MKLFFITYAGGSASFFNGISAELKNDFECILIEYAGRATRSKEPFYHSFKDMVSDVAAKMEKCLEGEKEPFCVFGYSMGSLVAYEALIKHMKTSNCKHLFVAAHYPPHASELRKQYSSMSDEMLCGEMEKFGGLDARIIANKRFLDIYLPVIRKDYQLLEEYAFDGEKMKVPCKITVFYSEEDTKYEVIRGWEDYTKEGIVFHRYHGNHFFLKKQEKEIAKDIRRAIE